MALEAQWLLFQWKQILYDTSSKLLVVFNIYFHFNHLQNKRWELLDAIFSQALI